MTTFVNGLNFRRNIFGDGEVTKINVEQVLEMKRQRLLEKENDNSNDALINNLCDMKFNYYKTKCNLMKSGNINALCTCWYIFNEFVDVDVQESMEADGNNEISLFNKSTMNRFHSFLNSNRECHKFIDPTSWDVFSANDSVNRFIYELSEMECAEIVDESMVLKIANEKWAILKQYFDQLLTSSNSYFMKLISTLCQRSVSSFSISAFDLALLYGLHNSGASKSIKNALNDTNVLVKRPIIFVIKYKCSIDFLLIPLLFKEAGIDSPVYFVGESKQVVSMKSILTRIGYVIVKNDSQMKYPKLQSFAVEKKAAMILEANRSICLIINDSINSYCSASGEQTEIRVLHSAVNAFIDGKLEEPLIVPLSLSHEYIPKEFLSRSNSLLSSNSFMVLRMMAGKFGIVKLSISKPIYYSQFSSNVDSDQCSTIVDTEHQLKKLVRHLSMFSDKCQLIMPTNLVAFLILYHFKDQQSISVQDMATVGYDLIKYILSSESLGFEFNSVITTIRRGCNMLSHCIGVSVGHDDCLLTVDWDSYSVISELDLYADVIVHKILMKSVAASVFVTETRFSNTMKYNSHLTVSCESMNNSITNIVKILLSRFFQFLLPCESLDNEFIKLNTWWNETMVSATRETDALYTENESHAESINWRADVYDPRVRDQVMMLSRCIAPRLETLNFIVMELMQNKQSGFDSMTVCSVLHGKVMESIKAAGKSSQLRFKSCMNTDHFVSGIITLAVHEMIRVFDISAREWILKPENVDLTSSQYAILDCEYYNLQRWKTFIDVSLMAA